MIAKDYISAMVNANPIIYIDTASLMDIEELDQFIENGEEVLRKKNRRIIVPQAVCLELVRHLGSGNKEKKSKAMRALELLSVHQDIFDVRNQGLNEDEVYAAFADAEILAELMRNKQACGQLLITNDRALSQDAFELNKQGSCRGHRIMVCFINRLGELRKCDCANLNADEAKVVDNSGQVDEQHKYTESVRENAESDNKYESVTVSGTDSYSKAAVLHILIPVGTYFLGILTCKYGKTAVQAITALI